jgi:hypothetical protein
MISFFGMPNRSSGMIRGMQVSRHVKGNFFDKNNPSSFLNNKNIFKNCVFIRDINQKHARCLKNKGHIIAYDIIDRPVADLHIAQSKNNNISDIDWKKYAYDFVDMFIVTNSFAKSKILPFLNENQRVEIIPHHLISNLFKKEIKEDIKNIGYLGTIDQIHKKEEIKIFCKSLNVNFLVSNAINKKDCVDFLKMIDVGIIFLEKNNRTNHVLNFKPNTKLTNFQSFGIPTIACDYKSFIEFANHESYCQANSLNEVFFYIEDLINNKEKRNKIIDEGYKNAGKFKIENICQLYKNIFNL